MTMSATTLKEAREKSEILKKLKYIAPKNENDYVFISYKSDDWSEVLEKIVYPLQQKTGLRIYYDRAFDDSNEVWLKQMQENMHSPYCKGIVVFISEAYMTSYATLMEVLYSQTDEVREKNQNKGLEIVHVLLDKEFPDIIKEKFFRKMNICKNTVKMQDNEWELYKSLIDEIANPENENSDGFQKAAIGLKKRKEGELVLEHLAIAFSKIFQEPNMLQKNDEEYFIEKLENRIREHVKTVFEEKEIASTKSVERHTNDVEKVVEQQSIPAEITHKEDVNKPKGKKSLKAGFINEKIYNTEYNHNKNENIKEMVFEEEFDFSFDISNTYGNSVSNLLTQKRSDRGWIAEQGEWVYFAIYNYIGRMKHSGLEQEIIYKSEFNFSGNLNVVGKNIYILEGLANDGRSILRISVDGKTQRRYNVGLYDIESIYVFNDQIFCLGGLYDNKKNVIVSCIDCRTGKPEFIKNITSKYGEYFRIFGNDQYIIYNLDYQWYVIDKGDSEKWNKSMKAIKISNEDREIKHIDLEKNQIYFTYNHMICKTKIDTYISGGSEYSMEWDYIPTEKISAEWGCSGGPIHEWFDGENYYKFTYNHAPEYRMENNYYYNLYSFLPDNTCVFLYGGSRSGIEDIQVAGEYIYFNIEGSGFSRAKINLAGNGMQRIEIQMEVEE